MYIDSKSRDNLAALTSAVDSVDQLGNDDMKFGVRVITALLALCASMMPAEAFVTAEEMKASQASSPKAAPDQPSAADRALVAKYTLPLEFNAGRISGLGAQALLDASRDAQFVMLSEYLWHVDHATPEFMAALFKELNARFGFEYIAVEQDYLGTQRLSTPPVRGDLDRIAAMVRGAPYALTFINDEELRMFADVGRLSRGRWRPIWGFDQVFGMTLPLEELLTLAPSANARAATELLLAQARQHEKLVPNFGDWRGTRDFETGHLISKNSIEVLPRIAALRQLYGTSSSGRAVEIIDALEQSARIYSYFQLASKPVPPGGLPVGYFNTSVREELMRRYFLANYRSAERLDRRLPRVLIKAGSLHLVEGRAASTSTFPIGNFFHEFATANGMEALNILMLPIQSDQQKAFQELPAELQLLAASADLTRPVLVDLRPLRNHFHAGRRLGASPATAAKLRDLIYGADFALFLPSGRASFALTSEGR